MHQIETEYDRMSHNFPQLIQDHQSYHKHQQKFINFIKHQPISQNDPKKQNRIQNIIHLFIRIKNIIINERYDAYSRLLALRFIKDSLGYGGYSVWVLICMYISKYTFQQIETKDNLKYQDGNKFSKEYLRKIMISLQIIILQMHQSLAKMVRTWNFNEQSLPDIVSNSFLQYTRLIQKQIKFPSRITYYKEKQINRMEEMIKIINLKNNVEEKIIFYEVLISKIFLPDAAISSEQYVDVFVSCAQGGDINWLKIAMPVIKQKLLVSISQSMVINQDFNRISTLRIDPVQTLAMKLSHALFMTGNIYIIYNIQNQLLLPLLYNYVSEREIYQNKQIFYVWGKMIGQKHIFTQSLKILTEVSHSLSVCHPDLNEKDLNFLGTPFELIIEQFNQNWQQYKYNNIQLSKFIKQNFYNKQKEVKLSKDINSLMKNHMDRKMQLRTAKSHNHKRQNSESKDFIKLQNVNLQSNPSLSNIIIQLEAQNQKDIETSPQKFMKNQYKLKFQQSNSKLSDEIFAHSNYSGNPLAIQSTYSKIQNPQAQKTERRATSSQHSENSRRKNRKGLSLSRNLTKLEVPFQQISQINQSNIQIYHEYDDNEQLNQYQLDKIFKAKKQYISSKKKILNLEDKKKNIKNLSLEIQRQGEDQQSLYDKIFQLQRELVQSRKKQFKSNLQQNNELFSQKSYSSHMKSVVGRNSRILKTMSKQLTESKDQCIQTDKIEEPIIITPRHKKSRMYRSQRIGSPLNSKLPKSFLKITNKIFDFPSSAVKKQILKPKNLLFKNGDLQIGLITKLLPAITNTNQLPNLQALFYVTALKKINSIEIQLKFPLTSNSIYKEWVSISEMQNHKAANIGAQQQFICKYSLKCSDFLFQKQQRKTISTQLLRCLSFEAKLMITYLNEEKQQGKKLQVNVPIFVTKFVENLQIKEGTSKKKLLETLKSLRKSLQQNPFSSFLNIEFKIMKGFDDFIKFFPHAVRIDSQNYVAYLHLPNNKYVYLLVSMLIKNQIEISFLYEKPYEPEPECLIQNLIFKGYCSLLGI